MTPALVMAGDAESSAFAAAGENPRRSQADIHGRPMASYVTDALRACRSIGPVILVTRPGSPAILGVDQTLEVTGSLVDGMRAGLRACSAHGQALVASADIPFLTPDGAGDYLDRCLAVDASLCWAAIERRTIEERFPGMKRTCVRLKEGTFTGGNIAFVRHSAWPDIERVLHRAYEARKKPWLLAHLMGPSILARLLFRGLSLESLEARVSTLLTARCRAVVTPYPEIGCDIDTPEDLRLARGLISPVPEAAK